MGASAGELLARIPGVHAAFAVGDALRNGGTVPARDVVATIIAVPLILWLALKLATAGKA